MKIPQHKHGISLRNPWDLGMSPGTSCSGFPSPCTSGPGTVSGTIHVADAETAQAEADASSAYTLAAAQTCTTTFSPITDVGGMTLTPGAYCFPSSAAVTGTLTLDAQENSNPVFIFEIDSTLEQCLLAGWQCCNPGNDDEFCRKHRGADFHYRHDVCNVELRPVCP